MVIAKSVCEDRALRRHLMQEFNVLASQFACSDRCRSLDYLSREFSNTAGFVVGHQKIDEQFLKKFPKLQAIAKYGVGLDNISFAACRSKGVKVYVEPGVNRRYVAEHTLALILALLRRIVIAGNDMRAGKWFRDGGQSLFGKTVGIVGFGHVGSALAELLSPFGCRVLYNDIRDRSEVARPLQARPVELSYLLANSDIVTMHVPLTEQTESMCDHDFFSAMKEQSVFINTARGSIYDPDALFELLKNGRIQAAACDVFAEEPYEGALTSLPNFIATPHVAANCRESKLAMAESAIRLLEGYFNPK